MTRDEQNKEFYHMLRILDTLPANMLTLWYKFDTMRKEALAVAIAEGKIGFQIRPPNTTVPPNKLIFLSKRISPDPFNMYEGQDYKRVELVKEYILTTPKRWSHAVLDTKDLLTWLNKTYPLDSTPEVTSQLPLMSDQLVRAVQFSSELYPEGYRPTSETRKAQKDRESARIRKHLKNKGLSERAKEALVVQLNPVK